MYELLLAKVNASWETAGLQIKLIIKAQAPKVGTYCTCWSSSSSALESMAARGVKYLSKCN